MAPAILIRNDDLDFQGAMNRTLRGAAITELGSPLERSLGARPFPEACEACGSGEG